jgi:hypothetical protein
MAEPKCYVMNGSKEAPAPLRLQRRGDKVVMDIELFENLLHKAEILGMWANGVYPDTYEYRNLIIQTCASVRSLAKRWEETK